jgi:hypothetical protein
LDALVKSEVGLFAAAGRGNKQAIQPILPNGISNTASSPIEQCGTYRIVDYFVRPAKGLWFVGKVSLLPESVDDLNSVIKVQIVIANVALMLNPECRNSVGLRFIILNDANN